MKEVTIRSAEDILNLEVNDLLGLLAAITVDENCNGVSMIIQNVGSNHGDFEFKFTCSKMDESECLSFIDKIKRWFK